MSTYEKYDVISNTYDITRKAIGTDVLIEFLEKNKTQPSKQKILDCGCGTGNYADFLKDKTHKITCLDFSKGMLKKAREKLESSTNIEFIQSDMTTLPFSDNYFDSIMCNQSIHHLDEPVSDFDKHKIFFSEAYRVLKNDGFLIINTISHDQLANGVWWGDFIKPAVNRMKERFATKKQLVSMLNNSGFSLEDEKIPYESIIQENRYHDYNAIFDKKFRDGDSHFSLLSAKELKQALDEVLNLINDNSIAEYLKDREKLRRETGQYTYYLARKN